jgi:hypothetical protein
MTVEAFKPVSLHISFGISMAIQTCKLAYHCAVDNEAGMAPDTKLLAGQEKMRTVTMALCAFYLFTETMVLVQGRAVYSGRMGGFIAVFKVAGLAVLPWRYRLAVRAWGVAINKNAQHEPVYLHQVQPVAVIAVDILVGSFFPHVLW